MRTAILGFSREGKSILQFLQNIGRNGNLVADLADTWIAPGGDNNLFITSFGKHRPDLGRSGFCAGGLHGRLRLGNDAFFHAGRIPDDTLDPVSRQAIVHHLPDHMIGPGILGIVLGGLKLHEAIKTKNTGKCQYFLFYIT